MSLRLFLIVVVAIAAAAGCGGGGGGTVTTPVVPAPPVDGPAWFGFGRDAQHSANGAIATQDLNRIAWSTPLDLVPTHTAGGALLIHYGSPVVTSHNTIVLPVKTGAGGGFRLEARSGGNGGLIWSAPTDYQLPPHNWVPSYNAALTTGNRLYAPGAGGKLLVMDDADAGGTLRTVVFYGAAAYNAAPAAFDASVIINTPLTVDAQGNVFFGFMVTAANPAGLVGGIARVDANGNGIWVSAATAAADGAVVKVQMNSAPALSTDATTLYVAVNAAVVPGQVQGGYLLALDSTTLAVKSRVLLVDPLAGTIARVSDDSTASPAVGPDGHVYFGVLESTFGTHDGRGWLLHFNATLTAQSAPGGFGWDNTPSIVPAAMVPSYAGTSTYLLMTKYNDYLGVGIGNGVNQLAVIDPHATQVDAISGRTIMKEILTIAGPTLEPGSTVAVKEWCINTAAVDAPRKSILVNSEDGFLYRWDLSLNRLTQKIQLTSGIGESYTPTAIGADGAVYAVNNAVLFSIGR
jgi:predicted secreted protein